jgi:hypothetical protein
MALARDCAIGQPPAGATREWGMAKGDLAVDPRGLIYEAYRMTLTPEECRSIFLDWALGVEGGAGPAEIALLYARYGAAQPDHPMSAVLREGLAPGRPRPPGPRRSRRR